MVLAWYVSGPTLDLFSTTQTNKTKQKMKDLKAYFSKDIQRGSKIKKRTETQQTSLAIREKQIKVTVRCFFLPTTMVK